MSKFNKYTSSNGIITTEWGPSAWNYLFCSIMGSFPFIIDKNNYEHNQISVYMHKSSLSAKSCPSSSSSFTKSMRMIAYEHGHDCV